MKGKHIIGILLLVILLVALVQLMGETKGSSEGAIYILMMIGLSAIVYFQFFKEKKNKNEQQP